MTNLQESNHLGMDHMLAFTLADRNAHGRVVRIGPVLDKILSAHAYDSPIRTVLGEALVLTALMGGLLKSEGSQLTMQAQTEDGIVELLVCDYRDGELRGYVKHDPDRVSELGSNPDLESLFGRGSLAITFEVATSGQRYQGIVPLEGDSLTDAVAAYFEQSEQVPTLIRTAVRTGKDGSVAGGLLIQHLADGEEGRERLHVRSQHLEWEHVSILGQSIQPGELLDPSLTPEGLVWRLFHEENEIRVQPLTALKRGCRCSLIHFEEVLSRFPKEDRRDMKDENGIILVDCAFCSKEFPIQD